MPDDTKIPNPNLPPGLSPVIPDPVPPGPVQPPGDVPVVPPEPVTPAAPPTPQPPVQPPPVDPSALADLAKSLKETPASPQTPSQGGPAQPDASLGGSTPIQSGSDFTPPSNPPQQVPEEPTPRKKSGGKTSALIGGLFLLIILPIVGYYVSQKTDITRVMQYAEDVKQVIIYKGGKRDAVEAHITPKACCKKNEDPDMDYCRDCSSTDMPRPSRRVTPTVTYTPTPIITGTPVPTETAIPTTTPVPTNPPVQPGVCDASCGDDSNCRSGLVCATVEGIKRCRNPQCTSEYSCVCPVTATPTPTTKIVYVVATPTPTTQVVVVTATPAPIAAAPTPKVPVSGTPAVLGAATVAGGILLLLLGLLL
jgi:hypothetical protein